VFKVDPSGNETVLYSFQGFPFGGANPMAGVVRDWSGNLYARLLAVPPRLGSYSSWIRTAMKPCSTTSKAIPTMGLTRNRVCFGTRQETYTA
jgi:hypothetical protein